MADVTKSHEQRKYLDKAFYHVEQPSRLFETGQDAQPTDDVDLTKPPFLSIFMDLASSPILTSSPILRRKFNE